MNAITPIEAEPTTIAPGIYPDISNDDYHAGPGISKTGLWTIYTKTPAHFRFGEREHKQEFDIGQAADLAILQPDQFESLVFKGPPDRRGNIWKDAQAEATNTGRLLLTGPDYESVQTIRDAVHADPWVHAIICHNEALVQQSAFAIDAETNTLVKCRPDLFRADLGLILDLKTAVSADPDQFARAVVNYGYHVQEALYSDIWRAAGGDLDGFAFLVVEKKPPFAFAVYELPPSIVDEGRAIFRKTLARYVECERTDTWPAYPSGVQELSFKRWSYRETEAPVEELAGNG